MPLSHGRTVQVVHQRQGDSQVLYIRVQRFVHAPGVRLARLLLKQVLQSLGLVHQVVGLNVRPQRILPVAEVRVHQQGHVPHALEQPQVLLLARLDAVAVRADELHEALNAAAARPLLPALLGAVEASDPFAPPKIADRAWLERLIASALAGDAPTALAVIAEVFEYGIDLQQFASDLVHCIRDIIVLRVAGDQAGLTDLSDEETHVLGRVGHDRPIEDLERLFYLVSRTAERMAHASFPRLEMEMAAIRMCRLRPLRSLDQIIERLSALERHQYRGAPGPPPPSGGARELSSPSVPTPAAAPVAPPSAPPVSGSPNLVLVEPSSSPEEVVSAPKSAQVAVHDAAPRTIKLEHVDVYTSPTRMYVSMAVDSVWLGRPFSSLPFVFLHWPSSPAHSFASFRCFIWRVMHRFTLDPNGDPNGQVSCGP